MLVVLHLHIVLGQNKNISWPKTDWSSHKNLIISLIQSTEFRNSQNSVNVHKKNPNFKKSIAIGDSSVQALN